MSERVDYPPRVREAIDELMCKKDATENRMSEYIVDYRWLRSRIFGQVEHLTDGLTKIVRCRDCRYSNDACSVCYLNGEVGDDMYYPTIEPDGFCKWGDERE